MRVGQRMAKQLDCTINIKSTWSNAIHGSHCGPHTTISRFIGSASEGIPGLVNISGVDWTTSKSNHSNRQMPYQSSCENSNSDTVMIAKLKMANITFEHYIAGIFSNVSSYIWHVAHFRSSSMLNRRSLLTLWFLKSTV
jgi:hypothetical protein